MRTMFTAVPFSQAEFTPRGQQLGLSFDSLISDLVSTGIKAGPDIYRTYQTSQDAEEARKKAQAQAAAAAAQAQAAASQAVAATAQAEATKFLGLPVSYWIVGGVGLAAIGIVLAVANKG